MILLAVLPFFGGVANAEGFSVETRCLYGETEHRLSYGSFVAVAHTDFQSCGAVVAYQWQFGQSGFSLGPAVGYYRGGTSERWATSNRFVSASASYHEPQSLTLGLRLTWQHYQSPWSVYLEGGFLATEHVASITIDSRWGIAAWHAEGVSLGRYAEVGVSYQLRRHLAVTTGVQWRQATYRDFYSQEVGAIFVSATYRF